MLEKQPEILTKYLSWHICKIVHKKQDGSCWPLSQLTLYQENHTVYSATFLLQNFGYTKMEADTILRINVDLTYRQHSQGSGSSTCATWYILVSFKMAYPIHVSKYQQPSLISQQMCKLNSTNWSYDSSAKSNQLFTVLASQNFKFSKNVYD